MGTVFIVYVYATNEQQASADFETAFAEVDRLDATLSNYQPTSEISRINRLAAHQPVTTDPEVFSFLRRSLDYSRRSNGAFDITVGPLMRAWGFFRGQGQYPSKEELIKARATVGWRYVELNPDLRTVRFKISGIDLDPGGIGKGYAVDRVVALLREAGVKSALVDAGASTIYALGAPPGKDGWAVQIPRPEDHSQSISTVLLRDASLSTSGNYEKFFRLNGHVYCHIMDPRTGKPVESTIQTTVIAPQATDSDALSTATFVMGPDQGSNLLRSVSQTKGLWVLGEATAAHVISWHWPAQVSRSGSQATGSLHSIIVGRRWKQGDSSKP